MEESSNESSELFEKHVIDVEKDCQSLRIDKFLSDRLQVSRNKIQNTLKSDNIDVNGTAVKANYKVKPGDRITVLLTYTPESKIVPEYIPLDIIYEDDSLVIINKPPGLVVHPGAGNPNGTLVNGLAYYLKDVPLFQSGEMRPGLVHRIDKDTSGLLVVAKSEYALNKLAKQFYERNTERNYIALLWGDLTDEEGTIEGHIGRSMRDRKKMTVYPEGEQGKYAETTYQVLERFGYVTLVSCKLHTGRTHQIRAHFAHMKHPVFNDEKYGGDKIREGTTFPKYRQFVYNCFKVLPRQALHAKTLGFFHPDSGEWMFFDSQLPEDIKQVIEKWRSYIQNRYI